MTPAALAGALAMLILGAVAAMHVYWALRGGAGLAGAVPEVAGKPLFRPGRLATLAVALALAGLVALLPAGCALAALGFLARAVGDFRHVGLFKRASASRFARLDTWVFSPLCLLLAGLVALVAAG